MRRDNRTLAELEKAYLSEDSAAEFDDLVRKGESRRRCSAVVWGTMLAAAASLALILTLSIRSGESRFNGIEMAEGIQQIMNLDADNIRSVTAIPEGNRVILTALMMDGSQCSYVMSRTQGAEAVSIMAMK